MKFDTALREYVRQKILEIGPCDIIVGIPTYNNEETITHVMKTVYEGLWGALALVEPFRLPCSFHPRPCLVPIVPQDLHSTILTI